MTLLETILALDGPYVVHFTDQERDEYIAEVMAFYLKNGQMGPLPIKCSFSKPPPIRTEEEIDAALGVLG